MANKRVTELDSLFSVATGDLFYVVDVSDLTMSEQGSSKKVAFSDLVAPLASLYASTSYVNSASGALSTRIDAINAGTGNFVVTSALSSYVQTSQTGAFLTSSDLTPYATTSYVNTASGTLDGKVTTVSNRVTTLEGQTGSYTLHSETGQFASDADVLNLSGYLVQQIGASSAGVSSLNGGSGVLTLNGLGLVSVARNGQNINISGASPDLSSYATTSAVAASYYPLTSGQSDVTRITTLESKTGLYVLNSQTGVLASAASVTAVSNRVTTLEGQTGSYALASQTGSFATTTYVNNVSGAINTRVSTLEGQTGLYVWKSESGQFASDQDVLNLSGYLITQISASSAGVSSLNGTSGVVTINGGGLVSVTTTGQNINISGASPDLSAYATTSSVAANYYPLTSGQSNATRITSLEGQTGNYVLKTQTGVLLSSAAASATYYTLTSGSATETRVSTLESRTGLYALASQTGSFLTTAAAAAAYYPLTSGQSDVTRITTLESRTGSYVLQSQTGVFATTASVAAGYYPLASGNALNAATGNYVLRSETGALATSAAVAATYYTITSGAATETRVSTLESKTGQYLTGVRAGTNVTVANNADGTYTINSSAAAGNVYTGQYINFDIGSNVALTSGALTQFIPFSSQFSVAPKVWTQIGNSSGDPILVQYVSGSTISGFTIVFSDAVRTPNYTVSYFATTGNGFNLIGAAGAPQGDYVTSSQLTTSLNGYATTSSLTGYYSKLSGDANRVDITTLKSQTGSYVLRSETGSFGGGAAASGVNQQKSITLMLPQSGDSLALFYTKNAINLARTASVIYNVSGNGLVNWNLKYATTRNAAGSNLISSDFGTNSQSTAQTQTSFTSSVPADNFVWFSVSNISGTVDQFHLTVDYI